MKIKLDFVSNSSSTSFLFIRKSSEFSLQSFLDAAGISKDSPLLELFENFYEVIHDAVKCGKNISNYDDLNTFLKRSTFTLEDNILAKVKDALDKNHRIISGHFSTNDGNIFEVFLCCESFAIECEDFILSAYDDAW